jgi:DNA polymerase-3 subunit epsilon
MSWYDGKLTVLDYESTGKDPEFAKPVEFAARVDEPGKDPIEVSWLCKVTIPEETEKFFDGRYTTERCMDEGLPEREVHELICDLLRTHWTPDDPVAAFNACYDLTLFDRTNIRLGGSWPSGPIGQRGGPIIGPVVDPYVIDRTAGKRRKGKRKLDLVCKHYGVPFAAEDAHVAIGDVRVTARLIRVMGPRLPQLLNTDLRRLYVTQQRWHAAWAVSMQEFIRDKKREENAPQEEIDAVIITGHWPITPRPDIHAPLTASDEALDAPEPVPSTQG